MKIYIPDGIYKLCKYEKESMEEFVKIVFIQWVEEYNYDDTGIYELIEKIHIIENEKDT